MRRACGHPKSFSDVAFVPWVSYNKDDVDDYEMVIVTMMLDIDMMMVIVMLMTMVVMAGKIMMVMMMMVRYPFSTLRALCCVRQALDDSQSEEEGDESADDDHGDEVSMEEGEEEEDFQEDVAMGEEEIGCLEDGRSSKPNQHDDTHDDDTTLVLGESPPNPAGLDGSQDEGESSSNESLASTVSLGSPWEPEPHRWVKQNNQWIKVPKVDKDPKSSSDDSDESSQSSHEEEPKNSRPSSGSNGDTSVPGPFGDDHVTPPKRSVSHAAPASSEKCKKLKLTPPPRQVEKEDRADADTW